MSFESWLWTGLWMVIGTIFGSFFIVVGIRLPVRKSIAYPPSACPHCGNRIRGIDLVPVIGWLWRLAKCRNCEASISPIYPLMELATGVCFAILYVQGATLTEWIAGLVLTSVLIVLAISDLQYRLIPNRIVYPSLIVCAVYRLLVHPLPLWEYGMGFVIGGGLLWLVSWVSVKLKRPAMGGGDIKLMALLGLLLGVEQIIFVILLSAMLGLIIGLLLMALKRISRQTFLPFGPFIGLAGFMSWVIGEQIIKWYIGLFVIV